MPARDGRWVVEVVDAESGKLVRRDDLNASGGKLRIVLPEFRGSVAIKARSQ